MNKVKKSDFLNFILLLLYELLASCFAPGITVYLPSLPHSQHPCSLHSGPVQKLHGLRKIKNPVKPIIRTRNTILINESVSQFKKIIYTGNLNVNDLHVFFIIENEI
jgi:hypothetical protein